MKPATFRASHLIRSVVSVLLIYLVLRVGGVFDVERRSEIFRMLSGTHLGFLAASLLIPFALNFSSALKWHMLLRVKQSSPGLWPLCAYYMVGQFYNLILPTSMGGDVVRIHELGRRIGNKTEAVASVFVERFTGLVMLIVIAALAVLVNLRLFNEPVVTISLAVFGALILGIGWLVLDPRGLKIARTFTPAKLGGLERLFSKLGQIQVAVNDYRRSPHAMFWAGGNSLLFYLLAILNVWVSARAFDSSFSLLSAVVVTPVIMLIMNLPVSIGNLGLLEFAFVFTLGLLGYPPELGLSAAVLMRFKTLLDAGYGAMLHPLILRGRSIKQEIADQASAD
jgi:uncharacterized protein (TIRG00374 family)